MRINDIIVRVYVTDEIEILDCALSGEPIPFGDRHLLIYIEDKKYVVSFNQAENKTIEELVKLLMSNEKDKKIKELETKVEDIKDKRIKELEQKIDELQKEILEGSMIDEDDDLFYVEYANEVISAFNKASEEKRLNLTFLPGEEVKYRSKKHRLGLYMALINYYHEELGKLKWYNTFKRRKINKRLIKTAKELGSLYDYITRYEEDFERAKGY